MQKIKERNNQPLRRLLVNHRRGQKFKTSWKATEEGNLTEMQRDLGITSVLQRRKSNHARPQAETTGERKEDGGRAHPHDAVRDASCSTRGSQQQMDVLKWTRWAANGKTPKLPPASPCRQWPPAGGFAFDISTHPLVRMCSCASTQAEHRDAVPRTWWQCTHICG